PTRWVSRGRSATRWCSWTAAWSSNRASRGTSSPIRSTNGRRRSSPKSCNHRGMAGEFNRDMRYITAGSALVPGEPGRDRAGVAGGGNGAVIVRRLLGLEPVLSMALAGPTHDSRSWTFDLDPGGRDPVLGIERLQEAYFKRYPDYPLGITVPAIVDVPTGAV